MRKHHLAIQEVAEKCERTRFEPKPKQNMKRSTEYVSEQIEPCFLKRKVEPKLTIKDTKFDNPVKRNNILKKIYGF